MKPTLLIIPGFGETTDEAPYKELSSKFKEDYLIVPHTPRWNNYTATTWLENLSEFIKTIDVSKTTVVSFSMGAYITLLVSETYNFKKVILCSLAPFFKEQLHLLPKTAERVLGVKRMKDFETYSIPNSLQCPAVFLFGSDDWPVGIEEAKKLAHTYKAKFELISNSHHELTTEYINIISRYI